MQIKVHPLFFAFALIATLFGQAITFVWTFAALILHELAHALVAGARGFIVKRLVLLPFGAMMSLEENMDRASSVLVGLAGPLCNLALVLLLMGLWWIAPASYAVTSPFFYANVSLGVFNLLPIYPLDGSRIVLGLSKNRLKTIKGLQIAGIVCSIIFMGLFIASAFFKINFSLGIIAVFLFYGASFGTREEAYMSVLDRSSKNYALGIEKKRVAISARAPLVRLYHHVSPTSLTTFDIVDENGATLMTVDEDELKKIALKKKLSSAIVDSTSIKRDKKL